MKRMSAFLRGYVKESILGPLFKLFEASLELAVPLIIAAIIDNGINGTAPDRSYVIKMSLLLLLLGAVGLAFSITAQYFAAKASVGYVTRLRSALFSHLGTLSYSDLDRLGTSTMITRMTSDANQIQTGLNLGLRLLLRSPFVVFGAMIMAFTIDTKSALSFVAAIILLSVVVFGIMLISIPLYKKVQSRLDGVTGKTRENLSGARVIRAFCKEDDEIEEFGHKNRELTSVQMYVGRISSLMNPLTYVIINVAILLLIYTGAIEVHAGNLTQGQVVALYNYMSQILVELIKLANLIITITKAVASGARINSVFDIMPSLTGGERSEGVDGEFAVEFSDVSLRYGESNEDSLSKISFKAKRGDTIGIIGGTGSGKTSLINLIPRFYDPTGGVVLINGQDARLYTEKALREAIAVVPQKAVLFKGSIRENMMLGNSDATDQEIFEALKIAQADDVVSDKGGLDADVEQGG
ncbi:MAG: ATP-binding cassette domain-containing protein, partial [Clostridia bacterium]|nr:ATP-binding cassette domain-containing protein [Clostridia bacterium]